MSTETYRIERFYFNRPGYRRTLRRGCTLAEAQAHCQDPETSSSTATSATARRRTERLGPWFDGYESESTRRGGGSRFGIGERAGRV